MKKALIVASVASMIDQFNMPNIKLLQSLGFEVSVACNFEEGSTCSTERIARLKQELSELNVPFYHIGFSRKVTDISAMLSAYRTLKKLIDEGFELIHCHSPIGGMICRLAARRARKKQGTTVIYTAHGFHFYRGAPKKNMLIYYPIEKLCSRMTDIIITINREDYALVKDKMKRVEAVYIPGVGIDTGRFDVDIDRSAKRAELGIGDGDFLLLSVGELNANKNHGTVIRAMAQVCEKNRNVHYCIVGIGALAESHRALAEELGIADRVHLLGFRDDIPEICAAADAFAFPSIREGLGVAAIEAMAAGLPLVVADNRGTRDYASDRDNGFVCRYDDASAFAEAISALADSEELCREMGEKNAARASAFDISSVNDTMKDIYSRKA